MITKVNTVALYVNDQEASRKFYVDVLGFEVRTDAQMGEMGRWLEVAPPGAQTAFVISDAKGFGKQDRVGDSADITLTCDDVYALHQSLAAQGISVPEPEKQDWGTFLRVTDPDGHTFVISS
ncbi:VOC family protein [Rugosimonospora acidiphila]|uniref:VOC family protein n=1 Tax=Rugosimonospora acidiphila TaxID=556531 RepID=A0ABP9RLC9_9ACTN